MLPSIRPGAVFLLVPGVRLARLFNGAGIRPARLFYWCQGSAWLGCLMVPEPVRLGLFFLSDANVRHFPNICK